MPDLSIIKDDKLRALIKASAKFNALSEFQQRKHLDGLRDLTPEQSKKVCEFFVTENAKEKAQPLTSEDKLEILNHLYDEIVDLEQKFTRLLKQESENVQRKQDDNTMDNLLNSLK